VGEIILLESVLSFLGLGIEPPMASWGNMLTGARGNHRARAACWRSIPALLIFITVICLQFLGRRAATMRSTRMRKPASARAERRTPQDVDS
jgi:ABC-type dipeptide/oligopeptide/nickel transport system permease subunit